jgi:dTDP-4-dehydrorhamnose 3,5-epimerase
VKVERTPLEGVLLITPRAFEDERGFFMEVLRTDRFAEHAQPTEFVQVNQSRSSAGVIRGLHFQWGPPPMGKLMRVVRGEAYLVAVDIRLGSPTLGQWYATTASADDRRQLWAPAGFARGFCALADGTDVEYFCTGTYNPAGESGIRWNDPNIGVKWPINEPILSQKDRDAQSFEDWLSRPEANSFTFP